MNILVYANLLLIILRMHFLFLIDLYFFSVNKRFVKFTIPQIFIFDLW
jgi:hypothetical protein